MGLHDFLPSFSKLKDKVPGNSAMPKLSDGARVAVMGGGPAGSLFSYFLLEMAGRVDLQLSVDIYEPRDFSKPAPQGCNMCAGVVSESLVQALATEGINLPPTVVQRAIDSYVMHTDVGNARIETPYHEKRIAALHRSAGPRGTENATWIGLDAYLMSLAQEHGAQVIPARITEVSHLEDHLQVKIREAQPQNYDLLAVTVGVNSSSLKMFEKQEYNFQPPKTTKTAIREFYLGKQQIEKYLGSSLHVFLLNIQKLDFAMIVPKGDYATFCMLGTDIDEALIRTLMDSSEVKSCLPPDWKPDQLVCKCFPFINVHGAIRPYADRMVFIGDSGVSRLYKDGIGAAYRAAKAAAVTAVFEGVSAEAFKYYYYPTCKAMFTDNQYGRIIFMVTHLIQRLRFFRQAVLFMASQEQQQNIPPRMSSVLWDTFTGSASYKDIFVRTLQPAFIGRLVFALIRSLILSSRSHRFAEGKDSSVPVR
jgi:flavin-dependent dehydrogenase